MREILFRGKRVDNGEWMQGDLMHNTDNQPIIGVPFLSMKKVIPSTIGQFTGLLDKNGTKIFEGDIVEGHCHSQWRHRLQRCVVVYERDGFEARHYLNYPNKEHYFKYKVLFSKDVIVIGNIHDNPELLESEVQGE